MGDEGDVFEWHGVTSISPELSHHEPPPVEEMNNRKRRNGKNEVVSVNTYERLIVRLLSRSDDRGHLTREQIVEDVRGELGEVWGPVDLGIIKIGKIELPRWRNLMAWALVNLRRARLVKSRGRHVVLMNIASMKWKKFVNRKKVKPIMMRRVKRRRQGLKPTTKRRQLFK
jgi:hypothetical protein